MTLEEIEDAIQKGHVGDTRLLGDCILAIVEIVKEQQRVISLLNANRVGPTKQITQLQRELSETKEERNYLFLENARLKAAKETNP